ncbi:MAG: quinone oxidoreductase [Actinomycetota bacterium]|nr:quinone oxidoreductase [Actinomycetota bacterium]
MRAVQIKQVGGPEVLAFCQIDDPHLTPGSAVVRVSSAGVNFIDIYHRTGRYPAPLPFTPGIEGVGRIAELSPDAPDDLKVGDRVGWVMSAGGYAQLALVSAARLIPIPQEISDEDALALLVQGMTAHYLAHDSHQIKPGEIAVVHSGAGGVGLLLTRYLKSLGAVVVATSSTPDKRNLAKLAGADHSVGYEDFNTCVMEISQGIGAHVVYDGVGRDSFDASITCLRAHATMVVYGAASGPVPAFELSKIAKGSLFLTRPSLGDFIADRKTLLWRAQEVFSAFSRADMQVAIGGRYRLADAAQAHRDLEGRKTTGKLILTME